MSNDSSVSSIVKYLETMINKRDTSIADRILSPKYVGHVPSMPNLDRMTFKVFIRNFHNAFPDFYMDIDETIITSSGFVLRLTFSGTHQGSFLAIPPTGAEISIEAISTFHVENGQIIKSWSLVDIFGLIKQVSPEDREMVFLHRNLN